MNWTHIQRTALSMTLAAVIGSASSLVAQSPVEKYTALGVDMGATGRSAATTVNITVTRWSTDAERDQLVTALTEKGPDKLLDVLRDMPKAGAIGTVGSVGADVRFARRVAQPNGAERVVLITDRPISFREAWVSGRSLDYPFTMVELRLNSSGEGEGKLSLATKISYDKDNKTVTLENYTTQPVLLTSVKRLGKDK